MSISSLRRATGCWVPYVSTFGMFKSSTKKRSFLPAGGPNVSFVRFSSTSSRPICTSFDDVRLEKFCASDVNASGSRDSKYFWMIVVFAVPDSPMKMIAAFAVTTVSSSHVERTVSDVGTMIDENLPSVGGSYAGTSPVHFFHRFASRSKVKSWSDASELGSWPVPTSSARSTSGRPASFLRNLSNWTRAACTRAPPSDQVRQRMKTASMVFSSTIARSSVRIAASRQQHCWTRPRFVIGVAIFNGSTIDIVALSSIPSHT